MSPLDVLTRWIRAREALLVALFVLGVTLTATVAYDVRVGSFNDDAVYVSLGQALAEGRGYRAIHMPGAPVHEKFPPGLPAILALLWWVGGSLGAVQVLAVTLGILVTAAAAALLYTHCRRNLRVAPLLAVGFVVIPFLLDPAIQFFTIIIAESWFVLAWAAVLIADARLADAAAESPRRRLRLAALLGLLLAATTFLRTQGILVAAATLGVVAIRDGGRRWRETLACALALLLPLAAWHWYHQRLVTIGPVSTLADESYARFVGGGLGELLRSAPVAIEENTAFYAAQVARCFSRIRWLGAALSIGGVLLLGGGLVRSARERPALAVGLLLNILVVLVWPYSQDRFIYTLLPFAGMAMAVATRDALEAISWGPRWTLRAATVAGALGAAVILENQVAIHESATHAMERREAPLLRSPDYYLPGASDGIDLVSRWLTTHTRSDDRVLSWYPAAVWFHSGRVGIQSSPAENIARVPRDANTGRSLAASIVDNGATVLILESFYAPVIREIAGLEKACPGSLRHEAWLGRRTMPEVFRMSPDDPCLMSWGSRRR